MSRTNLYAYHVTIRTINKEWFKIPLHEVWRICQFCLKEAHAKYPIELISFLLMSNHYHMLLKTSDRNLHLFMHEFHKRLMFGSNYKCSVIKSRTYLYNSYRYVYQNPRRAGIVNRCEIYPYSTLCYLIKHKDFSIPLFDQFGFKDEYALTWLNTAMGGQELQSIRSSLSGRTIKLS